MFSLTCFFFPFNPWKRYFKNYLCGSAVQLSKAVDVWNVTYSIAQEKTKQNQRSIVPEDLQPRAQLFHTQIQKSASQ